MRGINRLTFLAVVLCFLGFMEDIHEIAKTNHAEESDGESKWWKGRIVNVDNLVHPYLGARHPNGSLGMIIDPTVERLRSIDPSTIMQNATYICPRTNETGLEGEGGHLVLKKIYGGLLESKQQLTIDAANNKSAPRILCMIYTVYTDNDRHKNLASIADTWGRQCDGFFGASNFTDHSIGAIDLPHQGPEEYANMWQKIRTMWS
jgi:hypothetical protein